ncbi:unnamed protein product [Bursaphelenchus okinawaensis]|uniref:NADH-ubiquinone oxidoreductase MWFE subunit n=1 Tax=Bursaphelenchus okinawaensis TaxID=465554 RepID=A0A811L993_9BILA|nr:unnamed protein product [Bursaphelenchus okinawaensis]CAG9120096.1 unnamed protein product [Bursaphelenchus okinawaensis]
MWYEQIYSGAVTMAFIVGALYVSGPLNYLDTARLYRRNTANEPRISITKRDHNLTGNYYVISGLESIPDE